MANWVSHNPDVSLTPADSAKIERFRYVTWDFRATYQQLHNQLPERFNRPYPVIPLLAPGGAFSVGGTIRAGSGDYVLITQAPNEDGFSLTFTREGGSQLDGVARPRLNVIRLR